MFSCWVVNLEVFWPFLLCWFSPKRSRCSVPGKLPLPVVEFAAILFQKLSRSVPSAMATFGWSTIKSEAAAKCNVFLGRGLWVERLHYRWLVCLCEPRQKKLASLWLIFFVARILWYRGQHPFLSTSVPLLTVAGPDHAVWAGEVVDMRISGCSGMVFLSWKAQQALQGIAYRCCAVSIAWADWSSSYNLIKGLINCDWSTAESGVYWEVEEKLAADSYRISGLDWKWP